MAFFQSTRTDQNNSQNFYKILLHQIALFGLANWTIKVFPVFPRNIPYRARPKGPPFIFFGTARLFSEKKFPQRVPHSICLLFCDRMDVGKSQRVPLSVFFGTVTFFTENISFSPLQFLAVGKNFRLLMQSCCFFLRTFSLKFQISQKLFIGFSRNFAQSFYTQRGPCVRKGIKIIWLGCEKHSQI